jgi:succinylarginine dihydrolase
VTAGAVEVNFDGLPGPTHTFGGLAYGNLASMRHGGTVSNPRAAALQGLAKMKLLADLGVPQAVLPPHERPDIATLRRLGFSGSDAEVASRAARESPRLFAAAGSASAMWAANAATVSPGADTADGRVHFTPANLAGQLHRSLEPPVTALLLRRIFGDASVFAHHDPLPGSVALDDEGAANHIRLCREHGEPGVEIFVFGRSGEEEPLRGASVFPARQAQEASLAVARLHGLDPGRTLFLSQSPELIDAGVFHNDVISVGNRRVLLHHSLAFAGGAAAVEAMRRRLAERCGADLVSVEVRPDELPVVLAVRSYFFNSQLVDLPDGAMALIAPVECRETPEVLRAVERILADDNPIDTVRFVDLRESMKNGGGPACLRLRVVLAAGETARVHPGVFMTERLHGELVAWVGRHYRDRLVLEDLADPALLAESRAALDALTEILALGSIYAFQRGGPDPPAAGRAGKAS